MEITNGKEADFAKRFIECYSHSGFGSLNKNDFEVLIFDLLRSYGNFKDKSNFEISTILQIPESKVNRLSYESDLKYGDHDDEYVKKSFLHLISKAAFRSDNGRICFIVEDKYVRSAINAKLKELGHFADSSFNSQIVSVYLDSFVDLLNEYYPNDEADKIVESCKSLVKTEGQEVSFKLIMKEFLKGAANKSGGLVASTAFALLSGGSMQIADLIDAIKRFFDN